MHYVDWLRFHLSPPSRIIWKMHNNFPIFSQLSHWMQILKKKWTRSSVDAVSSANCKLCIRISGFSSKTLCSAAAHSTMCVIKWLFSASHCQSKWHKRQNQSFQLHRSRVNSNFLRLRWKMCWTLLASAHCLETFRESPYRDNLVTCCS